MPAPSLAQVQVASDRRRLARQPQLLQRKWQRMAASPFSFLRGASPLWAQAVARQPKLLRAAPGHGGLVGDLHLENFGVFRGARGYTFHVNDFDESFEGPWTYDVLRLLVSTLLARPELECSGTRVLGLAEAILDGHQVALAGGTLKRPPLVEQRVKSAFGERPGKLLDKRLDGPSRLERDAERYPAAPAAVVRGVPQAVAEWWAGLPPPDLKRFEGTPEVLDVTRWVAGTGSLGVLRLQVLLRAPSPTKGERGRGEGQNELLLAELKELRGSPAVRRAPDAAAVVKRRALALPEAPLAAGSTRLLGLPVLAHPLFDGEEKLSADQLKPEELEPTLRFLGFLTGEVHRRCAVRAARWGRRHQAAVLDAAGVLAGLHEQAFLEFCHLVVGDVDGG